MHRWLLLLLLGLGGGCSGATPIVAPPPPSSSFTPGVPVFGRNDYVEYIPGELAVIISAPHGGALTPTEIPDRTVGTTVTDNNTIELARAVSAALVTRTGRAPHVILAHLRRTKLDANREVVEAAAGNAAAITAWTEYHGFVDTAKALAIARRGYAVYLDLHGHGHAIARLELGYLLSSGDLAQEDKTINSGHLSRSSLRELPALERPFAEILRGSASLGGLMASRGFPAVPSPAMPSPGSDPYFSGGYSTSRHTVKGVVGLQIEHQFTGVRDTDSNRRAYAAALAEALDLWVQEHLRRGL